MSLFTLLVDSKNDETVYFLCRIVHFFIAIQIFMTSENEQIWKEKDVKSLLRLRKISNKAELLLRVLEY